MSFYPIFPPPISIIDVKSQWSTNEYGIYYNLGNVGIGGVSTSSYVLNILGDTLSTGMNTIYGALNMTGQVDISGNTHITGQVDISGNTNITGQLDVIGDTHITGQLDVSGNVYVYGVANIFTNGIEFFLNPTIPSQTYPIDTSNNSTASLGYVNSAVISAVNPVGTILMWGGNTTAPTDYLFCDGSSLVTTNYPSLFDVIGYTYNNPPVTSGTSFSLPLFHQGTNGTGVMPIGSMDTSGGIYGVSQSGGVSNQVYNPSIYGGTSMITDNQLAPHDHNIIFPTTNYVMNVNITDYTIVGGTTQLATGANTNTFPTDTSGGMTNFFPTVQFQTQAEYYPPFCSVMFVIKYQ